MRAQADLLASCITSSPHAALAAATRFVHTAWRDDGAGAARCSQARGEVGADGQPETASASGRGESSGRLVPRDSDFTAAGGAGGACFTHTPT